MNDLQGPRVFFDNGLYTGLVGNWTGSIPVRSGTRPTNPTFEPRKMNVVVSASFQDLQEPENPKNGTVFRNASSASELFSSLSHREPFIFELRGDNGYILTIGFAGTTGFAQHSPSDGSPPYSVAVAEPQHEENPTGFLAGNQLTEVPGRFCLPIQQIEKIAADFITAGAKSSATNWEEV